MKVSELAKELNVSSQDILTKMKALKFKAKDSDQELNTVVITVLRSELGKGRKAAPSAATAVKEAPPRPVSKAQARPEPKWAKIELKKKPEPKPKKTTAQKSEKLEP